MKLSTGAAVRDHRNAVRDRSESLSAFNRIAVRNRRNPQRIGKQLVKTGYLWALDIPAADTKMRRPLDYPISEELSRRIDLYLERFRCRIPGAERHTALWASNKRGPMSAIAIYNAVRRRTKKAFGFGVNLHAAASFWSIQDPVNVRGAKDLLGQASFGITDKHYIMAQSRLAGRALAHAVDAARK